MTLALLGVLLGADPCAPLPAPPDPREAAAYLAVGQEEEASGAWSSALEASRRAAGLAPNDEDARLGLNRSCARRALEEGEALLARGDAQGALARLSEGDDRPSALLRGAVLLDQGRFDDARRLLLLAHADPELKSSAALQLALLELKAGRSDAARRYLEEAEEDPRTAGLARRLAAPARQEGRIRASASLEGGYDSNPLLVPGIGLFGSAAPDGFTGAGAEVAASPFGRALPRVELRGAYRKYFSSTADDTGLGGASLRWDPVAGPFAFSGGYDFDFISFGEAPWELRHAAGLAAGGRWKVLTAGVGYQLRHEEYLQPNAVDDSGLRHAVRAWAGLRLGPLDLELAWNFTRAPLAVVWRGYSDDGGELWATLSLRRVTLVAEGNLRRRTYDAVDPDLNGQRDDILAEAQLRVEVQLVSWLKLYLAGEARTASSNIDGLSYTRFAGLGGLTAAAGWL